MKKRVFVSDNYLAWIAFVFMALPFLIALGPALNGIWWTLLIAPPLSYVFYTMGLHRYIRVIVLKEGRTKALPSLIPIDQIQYKVDVSLESIGSATYAYNQGDSKGNPIYRGWDIPCLRLKLQNGNEETILLLGYSLKQLDLLEKAIKIGNQNMTFTNDAKSVFKK